MSGNKPQLLVPSDQYVLMYLVLDNPMDSLPVISSSEVITQATFLSRPRRYFSIDDH